MSGSCTFTSCWIRLSSFHTIGNVLHRKYEKAAKISLMNNDKNQLLINDDRNKFITPFREDLVYSQESPDFCRFNSLFSNIKTRGRRCIPNSNGPDGCDAICCGHGFVNHRIAHADNCNCRWLWCCQVVCDKCWSKLNVSVCR